MDKPVSLSVKAWIIRQMSVRTMTQENVIETIVNHQFESALEAMDTCNSLEFSGFGRLIFNRKKAEKKLRSIIEHIGFLETVMNNPLTNESKRRNTQMRIDSLVKNLNYLNIKLNGYPSDIRRVEESPVSPETTEEVDFGGEDKQVEDMH